MLLESVPAWSPSWVVKPTSGFVAAQPVAGVEQSGVTGLVKVVVPLLVFTLIEFTPSIMACSSLYQSLMFTPHVLLGQLASVEQERPALAPPTQTGLKSTPPCGLKVRSTSLSLKTTFVRSLLLENGYWIEQFVTGQDRTQVWAVPPTAGQAAEVHEVPEEQVHAAPEML